MRVNTSVIIGLAGLFVLALPATSAAVDQFQPKVGEPVKLWHHAIKAGHMAQARAFFLDTLIPRMKVDNALQDSYFLVNEKGNEILAISFWGQADANVHPHAGAVDEGMKAHAAEPRRMVDYKLVLINDEGLAPQTGDKVVVISRKVQPGKMEDAKRAFREVIFPHLAKDEFTRNGYVLENTAGNELVSVIFMRGDFKVAPELAAKLDKHLKPHLSEPEKTTEYTLFGINNE
jgi:hypothetical protein